LVAHLFGNDALDVQAAGGYAYAQDSRAVRVVRVRSGTLVRKGPLARGEFQILGDRLGSGGQIG
jgi:hypothetical protein